MTNEDQADILTNIAAENGLNKEFFEEYRLRVLLALNNATARALAGVTFNEEATHQIKINYDWVCARLTALGDK